ncbi:MAG: oppB [Clostridiales bacterium]|jgi:oligopeptide transport system permease protein|nr:oppB [Clostridiales bacterium]
MYKYLLKRLVYMIIALWLVITASFFLMNSLPGNPFLRNLSNRPAMVQANFIIKWAFDQPVPYRYFVYMSNIVRGDLGESLLYPGTTASKMIKERLPATFTITVESMLFGLLIGVLLGNIAAQKNKTWIDYTVMFIAILGVSMPNFVLARLFQKYLSGKSLMFVGMLPTAGWATKNFWTNDGLRYSILPALSIGLGVMSQYTRYMRTVMLDIINQDYVLAARAKGLSNGQIFWKHQLRNTLIPMLTVFSDNIAKIITGTFVIERIYNIPGIGGLLVKSIFERDYTMIMAATIIVTLVYLISVFAVDILYGVVDPRIRINKKNV